MDGNNYLTKETYLSTEAKIVKKIQGNISTVQDQVSNNTSAIQEVKTTQGKLIDMIYPIGSIYLSTVNVNPSNFIGGEWEAWGGGRAIVGVNTSDTDFATAEKTGGAKTVNASHTHSIPAHTHTYGLQYGAFCQDVTMEFNANAGVLNYDSSGNITIGSTVSATSSTVVVNSGNVASYGSSVNAAHYRTTGNTSYTSTTSATSGASALNNLQPYITCFMFKRIS